MGVGETWPFPLALALEHLADLAERTKSHLGGESPDEMAKLYAEGAFLADDAALRALASVKTAADARAVHAAVRAVYLPWIDTAAERLQKLTAETPLPTAGGQETVEAEVGKLPAVRRWSAIRSCPAPDRGRRGTWAAGIAIASVVGAAERHRDRQTGGVARGGEDSRPGTTRYVCAGGEGNGAAAHNGSFPKVAGRGRVSGDPIRRARRCGGDEGTWVVRVRAD